MIIRRNTKTFKTIVEIVTACEGRDDRAKLIRLYITKAGHSIADRISVEGIEEETDVFYDLTFAAVVANLSSANHQLHVSDDVPGIYYFHSTSNKVWDENPFEFDERITKEFNSLPELPVTRKKEKPIKPPPQPKRAARPEKKGREKKGRVKAEKEKTIKPQKQTVKQPAYKLKHKIEFTNLDDVILRKSAATKRDILDYYNGVAGYILPFLEDRPQLIRLRSGRNKVEEYRYREGLGQEIAEGLPDWLPTAPIAGSKLKQKALLCNTKDHLLYYVENGCIDFYAGEATLKSRGRPDHCIIRITSPNDDVEKVAEVAQTANQILTALQLTSFVKTDGASGLHIYIPLDAKSTIDEGKTLAEIVCKLIVLKMPEQVALKNSESESYRKVSLDFGSNEEQEVTIAPYSLVPDSETIAVPLFWEEVSKDLRIEKFTPDALMERLSEVGDPFASFFKKPVNAAKVAEQLDRNYSFLFR